MTTADNNIQQNRLAMLGVILLLLATFGLRLYGLDNRPLWWDEGLTLTYAYLPPRANVELAQATEHLNPPLYNWLVGGLTSLSGVTVFTARLVSVYGGLLTAVAAYALARLAFGRTVSLIALLLLAVAPMQIYHAQEAKGYTVETAALLTAVYCWLKLHANLLPPGWSRFYRAAPARWPWWAGYAAATLLAMGANYLAVFGLIILNLFSLLVTVQAARRGLNQRDLAIHWLYWLTAQAAGVLPLLPYVWVSLSSVTQGLENTSIGLVTLSPGEYSWRFLQTFIVSERPSNSAGLLLTLLILLLAGGGLLWSIPDQWRTGRWFTAVWFVGPLLIGYLFHLRFAWFFPRYLLYIQPALLILAGIGLARLAASRLRPLAPPLVTAVLLLSLPVLQAHYAAPANWPEDEDWPPLFAAIQPYLRAGDGVIARASWMPGYMAAYLPPEPQTDWLLGYFEAATMDATLTDFLAKHGRVWQIDYEITPISDLNDSAVWMRGHAGLAYTEQIGTASAALFVAPTGGEVDRQVGLFANGVYVSWTTATAVVKPGDAIAMQLIWGIERPLDSHLLRFLHIIDSEGRLVAQVDREPLIGSARSYAWAVDEAIVDPAAIVLPPALPPGRYAIRLGLYDRDTLERVELLTGEDYLLVGEVEIR